MMEAKSNICLAHLLHLIVKKTYERFEFDAIVIKIRTVMKYFSRSKIK